MLRVTSTKLLLSSNSIRFFSTTKRTANLIQDLYLKELSNVKNNLDISKLTTPVGNVQEWHTPNKPQLPKLEGDEKIMLNQYINSKVSTLNESSSSSDNTTTTTTPEQELEEDWLVIDDIKNNDTTTSPDH